MGSVEHTEKKACTNSSAPPPHDQEFCSKLLARAVLLWYLKPAIDTIKAKSPTINATNPLSKFYSVTIPDVSVEGYVDRVMRFALCSNGTLIAAVVLMERAIEAEPSLAISPFTYNRLLITCIVVSAKFLEMAWYSSSHYAKVGGIATPDHLNRLEMELLKVLDFRAFVSQRELIQLVRRFRVSNLNFRIARL